MAAAAPILSLVMGVVGAVGQFSSARGQGQAADRQEEAARESARLRERNAQLIESEGQEQMRRERKTGEREQSLTRARSAASGVTGAGTPGLYLTEQKGVAQEELDWLDYSTQQRVAQERTAGRYDFLTGSAQAGVTRAGARATRASALGGLAGSVSDFGGAYNWWQK